MNTYEITQLVEMTIKHKVRAKNADEANSIAAQRTAAFCERMRERSKSINFGDIVDDYIPASDS